MSDYECDLFVIGAGSGGTRAARVASQHGARVKIAEDYRVGGTCVIRGCVPKKLMVYASRFADAFEDAEGFGWSVPKPSFHWRAFVEAKDREITRLSGIYVKNLEKAGVEILRGRAKLVAPQAVEIDGRRVTAERILVATGGQPVMPGQLPGIEHAISSDEIFDLAEFPRRLLIVGGGYIGVEFASIFTRLGSQVTLVNRANAVLRAFDIDMREGVQDALVKAGVILKLERKLTTIEKRADGLAVTLNDGETIMADQVLMAIGRKPSTKELGLADVGVDLGPKGEVRVDPLSRSSVRSIYAVGDVTDRVALTPVAIREGQAFADTVYGGTEVAMDHSMIPTAVFTTPEVGSAGLTEEEAKEMHACVDVYCASFKPMLATLSGRDEQVIVKMIVDADTDRVLGVHMLGDYAGELAQLLGVGLKAGATKADFDRTCAVHPTAAEELVTLRTRRTRHERMSSEPTGPGMADAAA